LEAEFQEYPKWVPDPDDPEKGRVILAPEPKEQPEPKAQETRKPRK
jgi:hypothetical protein